ncbi:hypothetical protein ACFS6H_02220 [Terrimonas rubra]|uniref:Uncharacterized protein n=1 Tax=Terrimonas rubra TaxID=1035890 RepID=A0ABW6A0Y2_9BACT
MEIYKLNNDHHYKNITGIDAPTITQFHDFKGQELSKAWITPQFDLLEHVATLSTEKKSDRSKLADFDLRCYGNILIVKSKYNKLFAGLAIEFLPVKIVSLDEEFSFINVLTIVAAINFTGLDYKQSMDMLKSDNINFDKAAITGNHLFRDKKIINFYYCTGHFKKIIEDNQLKGLHLKKAGIAS